MKGRSRPRRGSRTTAGLLAALAAIVGCQADDAGRSAPSVVASTTPVSVALPTTTAAPSPTTEPVDTVPSGPPATYGGCVPADAADEEVAHAAGTWRFAKVSRDWHLGFYATEGTRGAVVVVGDSLTKSSVHETMSKLIDAGFGPICLDAGFGRYLGTHRGPSSVSTGVEVIARIKASEPVWGAKSVTWVIALGTNDVGFTTAARGTTFAATWIGAARDAIGPTTTVPYWVNIATGRPPAVTVEQMWNEQLLTAGVVIDWADAVAGQTSVYLKGDQIHLTAEGVVLRSDLVVHALTAAPQQETP